MTVFHLVFALGTSVYILVAIRFEVRDLVENLSGYEEYQRRVANKLIPSFGNRVAAGKEAV
jgi:protein-S-isoprenylcysteine O-methyltransferase Ste14